MTIYPNQTKNLLTTLAGFSIVGLLLAGCGNGDSNTADGETDQNAEAAAGGDPNEPEMSEAVYASYRQGTVTPAFAATEIGASEEFGLDIEPTWIENTSAGLALVLGGDAQFSYASYWGVVDAISQGVELAIVAENFRAPEGFITLEALPDSGIETLEDLQGKTVGIPGMNTLQHNRIQYLFLEAGLDPNSVEFVEFPFGEVASGLANETIDAGSVAGPPQYDLKDEYDSVTVVDFNAGRFEDASEGGIIATQEFVDQNPNTVAAFQCVWNAGGEEIDSNDDMYVDLLIDEIGFPEELAEADAANRAYYPTEVDLEKIQDYPDIMVEIGTLDETIDMEPYIVAPPEDCQ